MEKKVDYRRIMDTERVISIKDLMLYILEKVWLLLVFAVIGAALYAGYKYVRNAQSTETSESLEAEDIELLESEMTDEAIAEVQAVLVLEDTIESQTEYLTNSVYAQLDAQCVDKVVMSYQIYAADDTELIADFYVRYVNNGGLAADLLDTEIDLDTAYLKELISASNTTRYLLDEDLEMSSDTNVLTVTVVHEDREQCEELAELVASAIEAYHENAVSTMGTHKLTQTDSYYNQVVDFTIWDKVNSYTTNLASEQTCLDTMTSALDEDQTALLAAYEVDEEDTDAQSLAATEEVSVGISKKAIVIGAIGGIALGVFFLAIWYVLRGTVNCAREIQAQYNFRILGEMETRKGLFRKEADEHTQLALMTANIQSACKAKGCDSILLVGALADRSWFVDLQSELQKAGIKLESIDGSGSAENIKKIGDSENVILTALLYQTKCTDLQHEIYDCLEQQADILGVVVSY